MSGPIVKQPQGQPRDATLTALGGLNSTPGLVEQTGADAFTKRAIGAAAASDILQRSDGDTRYLLASNTIQTRITSDFSTTSTTLVDVTGGTVAMLANTDYYVECDILFQSTATTTGVFLSLNGPASPTSVSINVMVPTTTTGIAQRAMAAYNGGSVTTDVPALNTTYFAKMYGIIRNGANAGDLQLRLAAETAVNVSVRVGSTMTLTKLT